MAGVALSTDADVTSFLHVEDAAMAAVQALNWPTGAVNIVDDEPAPASVWSPVFASAMGVPVPTSAETSVGDGGTTCGSSTTGSYTIGASPRSRVVPLGPAAPPTPTLAPT
jgi:hypothetical protein